MFPAILPLPIPGTKGRFPGDAALLSAGAAEMHLTASGLLKAQPAPQQLLSGLLTERGDQLCPGFPAGSCKSAPVLTSPVCT